MSGSNLMRDPGFEFHPLGTGTSNYMPSLSASCSATYSLQVLDGGGGGAGGVAGACITDTSAVTFVQSDNQDGQLYVTNANPRSGSWHMRYMRWEDNGFGQPAYENYIIVCNHHRCSDGYPMAAVVTPGSLVNFSFWSTFSATAGITDVGIDWAFITDEAFGGDFEFVTFSPTTSYSEVSFSTTAFTTYPGWDGISDLYLYIAIYALGNNTFTEADTWDLDDFTLAVV